MPLRTFTVTGTPPAPRTAAPTRRAISRGFTGIALPPPWRVIFGAGQPKLMARRLAAEGVHHIDINFGCPAPKITRHGGGSAIPVKPRLMARLVRAAVRGAGSVPVTVKVRKGIDDALLTYLDAGRVAEEEGAAAIGLHARTAAQLYAGDADWS